MPESRSRLARILRRLLGAGEPADVARALRELTSTQQRQTTMLQSRLKALAGLVGERASAKDANEILHSIWALSAQLDGTAASRTPEGGPRSDTRLLQALDDVARGDGPIVVGPWTGEVGFEVLYWVPFVEWFRTRWRVSPDRFVIVSRGGVASWYGMPEARYVDVFSMLAASVFIDRAAREKQRQVSALDRELLDEVSLRCGLAHETHLHPRLMYQALSPFWKDQAGFGLVERFTLYRRMTSSGDPTPAGLPDDYVAVRFYSSGCFPDNEQNRAAAGAVISALSQRSAVVVLSSGLRVDDHADYGAAGREGVIAIGADASAETNLAVQSAVIARARAFVGTYGGYSYLAPFYGVPSVGLYSRQTFKLHHLHAAQRALERLGGATVTAVDVAHAGALHAATGGL